MQIEKTIRVFYFSLCFFGVIGYNEKRHLECKYRLDRMYSVEVIDEVETDNPSDYDVQDYFNQEFSMMSGDLYEVHLLCKNDLMDSMIDKFGVGVQTKVVDGEHFEVITSVKRSGTTFGRVFSSE